MCGYGLGMRRRFRLTFKFAAAALSLLCASGPLSAEKGALPYWASLRVAEANMRVGPSEDYRISWVYRRQQLPLKVVRLKEGWRLVQDPGGASGWILSQFLTRQRGAIVVGSGLADMREAGNSVARLKWRLQPGVVGKLGDCAAGWCALEVGVNKGFAPQDRLWGAGEP